MDAFCACALNDYELLLSYLQGGNDVNERNDIGMTYLHICATYGSFECAQLLLEAGASFVAKDFESGWTPLHRSLYFGHPMVSLLLLQAGAKLEEEENSKSNLRDREGFFPIDLFTSRLGRPLQSSKGTVFAFGKADVTLGIPLPKACEIMSPKALQGLSNEDIVKVVAGKYHCLSVSRSGRVYSWGHGRCGKLGHNDEATYPTPEPIQSLLRERIVSVALSESHSLAMNERGEVFTWGSNRFGQLGHGDGGEYKMLLSPKRVESLRRMRVSSISCGDCHSLCSTASEVYAWGSNRRGQLGIRPSDCISSSSGPCSYIPRRVSLSLKDSVSVCSSFESSLALVQTDVYSEVWQWGDGVLQPRKISFASAFASNEPRRVRLTQVVVGRHNFSALTTDGVVLTWGLHAENVGRYGDSGNQLSQPRVLPGLPHQRVVFVATGGERSMAITETGEAWTWGMNTTRTVAATLLCTPKKVEGLRRVSSVALSEDITLIVTNLFHPRSENTKFNDAAPAVDSKKDDDDDDEVGALEEDSIFHDKEALKPVESLVTLCERSLVERLSLENAVSALSFALSYHARYLQHCTLMFLQENFDAVVAYCKSTDIDRALSEWKISSRSLLAMTSKRLLWKESCVEGSLPISIPVRREIVKLENEQEQDARRLSQRRKELEAVSSSAELRKIQRSTRKKLAKVGAESSDEIRKSGDEARASERVRLQSELAFIEQLLVRWKVREERFAKEGDSKGPDADALEIFDSRKVELSHQNQPMLSPDVSSTSPQPSLVTDSGFGLHSAEQPSRLSWANRVNGKQRGGKHIQEDASSSSNASLSTVTLTGRTVLSPTDPSQVKANLLAEGATIPRPTAHTIDLNMLLRRTAVKKELRKRKKEEHSPIPSLPLSPPQQVPAAVLSPAPTAWSKSTAVSPRHEICLLDIVREEEDAKQRCAQHQKGPLRGNESAWLVERKLATSFSAIVEEDQRKRDQKATRNSVLPCKR